METIVSLKYFVVVDSRYPKYKSGIRKGKLTIWVWLFNTENYKFLEGRRWLRKRKCFMKQKNVYKEENDDRQGKNK